jgi:predicted acetylornithine/succinylornithine family transaminase
MSDTAVVTAPQALALEEPSLLAPLYPLPRLKLANGQGAYVHDEGGREYLDFVSGIAVNAFGHSPNGLAEVVAAQVATLGQCSNLFAHAPGVELAAALAAATGYPRVFFCNSGTEGIDAALKFARARAGKQGLSGRDIVAFRGGFHGRTGFALSATWNPPYREPFEPLIPGIRFADYNDVAGLATAIDERTCAVIVEPVQGENGAVPATREFLRTVRERTSAVGAALVLDEVQTGMGRTGRLLAQEHFGIRGEMTVMSKALGAGLPIGAVLMTEDVAAALAPGMHGCTFGGNPVCSAAANWALAKVTEPGFLEQVRLATLSLESALASLVSQHSSLHEARGLGLLRAIELEPNAPFTAPELVAAARERGLLLVRGGERAVRLLPPLTVTNEEIAWAMAILGETLTALEAPGGEGR